MFSWCYLLYMCGLTIALKFPSVPPLIQALFMIVILSSFLFAFQVPSCKAFNNFTICHVIFVQCNKHWLKLTLFYCEREARKKAD